MTAGASSTMKVGVMRIERRQFGRRTTSLHAWIRIPGRPQIACHVRNLSVGGALIDLDVPDWLPYRFRLVIEATRFETDCETRHRGERSIGVMFIETKPVTVGRAIVTDKDLWGGLEHTSS